MVVISQGSIKSSFVAEELAFAYSQGAWIVPVVLGNPNIPDDIYRWLDRFQHISANPKEEDFTWVVELLDSVVKKKIANITSE